MSRYLQRVTQTSPNLRRTVIDSVILRPVSETNAAGSRVPSFALIETRGPDPLAIILSPVILTTLLFSSIALGRLPHAARTPLPEDVTMLVAPPEAPALPDISKTKTRSGAPTVIVPKPDQLSTEAPAPNLPEPEPTPIKVEPATADLVAARPVPAEIIEKPTPIPTPPERTVNSPAAVPAITEVSNPIPQAVPERRVSNLVAHDFKPAPDIADRTPDIARDVPKSVPASLGGLPLSQLIEDQDGLAAGLAALPSTERLSLPRVSIRVNAEWLEALPKTQERLYFSITAPKADGEVLAYLPNSHSFDLERPEHPLWQIHDGERVPALAELRTEAGRWLGVSPELVGLYTWHPPVFEDALRMFVLQRMQELRVHLGPRDIVTVRLTPRSEGTVMNLEPIRQEASIN